MPTRSTSRSATATKARARGRSAGVPPSASDGRRRHARAAARPDRAARQQLDRERATVLEAVRKLGPLDDEAADDGWWRETPKASGAFLWRHRRTDGASLGSLTFAGRRRPCLIAQV